MSANQLFLNRTTNYTTPTFPSMGNYTTLLATGTWGGALLTIEASPDGGTTWIAPSVTLAADGIVNFMTGLGILYRISLSNASGTTNLSAWLAYEI